MINFYDVKTAQERAQERYAPIIRQNELKRANAAAPSDSLLVRLKRWLLRRGSWQRAADMPAIDASQRACCA